MQQTYRCSKCNLAVIILPGIAEPIKACNCKAPIIAEISAITYGSSSVNKVK